MWGWWSYRSFHDDIPLDEVMVRRAYQALVDVPATELASEQEDNRA
jgi:hypothetical protein